MKKELLLLLFIPFIGSAAWAQKPLYKNANAPIEQRVKDLLQRMTPEEKYAQMQCFWVWRTTITSAQTGLLDTKKAQAKIPFGIGQIARVSDLTKTDYTQDHYPPQKAVALANSIQKFLVEKTRLGIPAIFHEESLHGNQGLEMTNVPTPIALAGSFDTNLVKKVYTMIAKETRLKGGHLVLAPVVDIARDFRWGRTEETMGEDPYLVSRMSVAVVKAYQDLNAEGNKIGKYGVISTLKHFGVHGASEGGMNGGPSHYETRHRYEYFWPSFRATIKEARPGAVMPNYTESDGIPVHAHKHLLQNVLRKEFGFKGVIVSDYNAIREFDYVHNIVAPKDSLTAGALALNAGVDAETPDPFGYGNIAELIRTKRVEAWQVDSAVARILRAKFMLGLFENPYADAKEAVAYIASAENRKIALEAAHQSAVLLKNEANTLPLSKSKYKTIALIGPNADKCYVGGYSGVPKYLISPKEAFEKNYSKDFKILYHEGVTITTKGDWWTDTIVTLADRNDNLRKIEEAKQVASQADVVVLFLGQNPALCKEAWSKTHPGDSPTLELRGEQYELLKAMKALGKPVVTVINNGQPMVLKTVAQYSDAVFEAWYLGQETGFAIADLLTGAVNPSAKLTVSLPRSDGHLPSYYNYKSSARRTMLLDTPEPLYPFGFGLSYSKFEFGKPMLSSNSIKAGESVKVRVEVTNNSNIAGAEVVQVYVRDKVASVTRPVIELKGFSKVFLQAKERKQVELILKPEAFTMYNQDMKEVIEAGEFEIMVGNASNNTQKVLLKVQ